MKHIYIDILNQIKINMPEIKYIDFDHGYTNTFNDTLPFPTPAILINFQIVNVQNTTPRDQQFTVNIILRLCLNRIEYSQTGSDNDQNQQLQALQYFDILDNLFYHLQAYSTPNFSQLNRISLQQEGINDGIFFQKTNSVKKLLIYKIIFQTTTFATNDDDILITLGYEEENIEIEPGVYLTSR